MNHVKNKAFSSNALLNWLRTLTSMKTKTKKYFISKFIFLENMSNKKISRVTFTWTQIILIIISTRFTNVYMELLSVFVSPCLNKTSLHYPNKSATWMKKCQRKFQKTDTIQTERDHILMLLKRWRTSREETEIQKDKRCLREWKTICYVLTKKKNK